MSLLRANRNRTGSFPVLFDDFLNKDLFNWNANHFSGTNTTVPSVNIRETNENYEVEVAAPGMDKEDFNVELNGNELTISSEKSDQAEDNNEGRYTQREFSYQSFQRRFTLQRDVVDLDKIEARYQNGILHLLIPKKEEVKQKPPKRIIIS